MYPKWPWPSISLSTSIAIWNTYPFRIYWATAVWESRPVRIHGSFGYTASWDTQPFGIHGLGRALGQRPFEIHGHLGYMASWATRPIRIHSHLGFMERALGYPGRRPFGIHSRSGRAWEYTGRRSLGIYGHLGLVLQVIWAIYEVCMSLNPCGH